MERLNAQQDVIGMALALFESNPGNCDCFMNTIGILAAASRDPILSYRARFAKPAIEAAHRKAAVIHTCSMIVPVPASAQ